jgi:putative membrane-bound dehydrogenase-like protein
MDKTDIVAIGNLDFTTARRCLLHFVVYSIGASLHCNAARAQEAAPQAAPYEVGLAKIDITPDYPIRLSGFSFRQTESDGVRQRIFARAMAVKAGGEPAVLITVDSIGIPPALRAEVARRLHAKRKLLNERLAICSTHSHTAPSLAGILPTMFGAPLPAEHQEKIDRYTTDLTDRIEQVANAALDDLRLARLSFGIGKARFAINRRTRGGPVDHDLPVMVIAGADGTVRGIYLSYACHCVVLSDYKVSGDWAGYAAEEIENTRPGSVALVSIGCGADANPESGVAGDKAEFAQQYGSEIAAEVERLLRFKLPEMHGEIECKLETIKLPLQQVPTREEWAKRADAEGAEGYYARVQLTALDRGDRLPTEVVYPIQTWKFGDSLAAVFLPGEVVVDYSLRLKKEFDRDRICINAYTNDCPGYIPSERILKEGGYEGGGAMIYYGLPAPFAPGLEDKIISTIAGHLGEEFKAPEKEAEPGTQGSLPKSPAGSLASIQVRDDLRVELVAAEPMVRDPVAIDFGPDGKVWVAEMIDYGFNIREQNAPLGRITVLEDRDADGQFETATRFLENISMPMSVTVWRNGVLICAAPDILYAEDTTGDGKADVVKKLFTGFGVQNAQARVNGPAYGLDGWLYFACTFAGDIERHDGKQIRLPDGDFRMDSDLLVVEPETGRTQQGRVRDDWGNWFGCNNTVLCFHYPMAARYLERNRHVVPPNLAVSAASEAATQLFPRGELVLFELSGPAGRPTAACGIGVYRDELLGPKFNNNLFVCDPVNQLVHRLVLHPAGVTFVGERAADETDSEFLTSTDNWFRPVQARMGPDGALWIVDMYRYVIEYSHWIPPTVVDQLDLRAGNSLGRIYRVLPRDAPRRALPQLEQLNAQELAAAMDTPNGTQRDMVQQMLVWRGDAAAAEPLAQLAASAKRPAARMQALCTLDLMGKMPDDLLVKALADTHAGVRRQAVRLAESHMNSSRQIASAVIRLADEADASVALQLACSLGELDDAEAKTAALASLARRHADDEYIVTAMLTSVDDRELGDLIRRLDAEFHSEIPIELLVQLAEFAGTSGNVSSVEAAIEASSAALDVDGPHRFSALAALLAGMGRDGTTASDQLTPAARERLQQLVEQAASVATDDTSDLVDRMESIQVIGRNPFASPQQLRVLSGLLSADKSADVQFAAIDALAMQAHDEVALEILSAWPGFTPSLRARAVEVLLSRKRWAVALVSAIDKKTVPVSELDTAQRARLIAYPDEGVRRLAAQNLTREASGERAAVVAHYARSELKGDAVRGKALYQKHCASCHAFRGTGSHVGPGLDTSEYRSKETMLREILDPNRAIDGRYAEYVAITTSGRVKNGLLAEESGNSIKLRGQQGEDTRLLRSELESLTSTGKSLMPEGFENEIPPQDMADLIEYLCSP